MQRLFSIGILAAIALAAPRIATAQVHVERRGAENPMVEVFRSTIYGGLAGTLLGAALAVASEDDESDGDFIRWGFAGGTFFGFGYGLYHVGSRPGPSGLLRVEEGEFRAGVPTLAPAPSGPGRPVEVRLCLLSARF